MALSHVQWLIPVTLVTQEAEIGEDHGLSPAQAKKFMRFPSQSMARVGGTHLSFWVHQETQIGGMQTRTD
jgi:hypothetical protein